MVRRATPPLVCAWALAALTATAVADDAKAPPSALDGYLELLEQKKLAPAPAESVDELSALLETAQRAMLEGQKDEASSLLLEAVEGPRFRGFEDLAPYHTAELLLASSLLDQHAVLTAQRVIDRLLARGSDTDAFGPAYRRAVDIALARGDLDLSAKHLEGLVEGALPEDAANELHYLRARAAYDREAFDEAKRELSAITKRSRFYSSAQYLLGAIAAKRKDYKEAEARFCSIASADKNDAFSFYVDGRFYPVRDLSYLGLGRVAHETGRANDAFYYYFQIPNDSERVAEAMFEAAWATYEGGDHDAALDSLDQLSARYPRSPFSAEAAVLRGYVHLSRCEFGEAEKHLLAFEKQFGAVLREIDTTLESPSRKQTLYRDLVAREASIARMKATAEDGTPSPDSILLALVTADPEFYRLHAELEALDAELARTGNVPNELAALGMRVQSKDAPAPRLAEDGSNDRVEALHHALAQARSAIDAFEDELRALSLGGANKEEIKALRETRRRLDGRVSELESKLREALGETDSAGNGLSARELAARFSEDQTYVEQLRLRAHRLRVELEAAANRAGERALRDVRERLAKELRRARIGRIDAVMGSKRQVELQIESLAAGRFPPELVDPLRMQSLLRDDEEYWPFEGEDWPDEFVERYVKEEP